MEINYSDIEKLAELRDKGLLTEQEFQVKKSQILGSQQPPQPKPKKKNGCLKVIGVFFLAVFIMSVIAGIFSDEKNNTTPQPVATVEKTPQDKVKDLEKELENKKLTKVQRKEIEIEIKSIKTTEWAKKNINGDMSNFDLKRTVEKSTRNPDTFEHISTTYSYGKDFVTAVMTYRGQNGFGGMSIEKAKGVFDYNGNLLEVSTVQ